MNESAWVIAVPFASHTNVYIYWHRYI